MRLFELDAAIDLLTAERLAEFESVFSYPLGQCRRFRIEHSPDYAAFYRAMGRSRTWCVEAGDIIVAAISVSIRSVWIGGQSIDVVHIGDLKIRPEYQSGLALFYMARQIRPFLEKEAVAAYGIVMNGTPVTPDQYTGRLGIVPFNKVANISVLCIETGSHQCKQKDDTTDKYEIIDEPGFETYGRIAPVHYCVIANTSIRSSIKPQWLVVDGLACGMLEDTRLAKRLYLVDGGELTSAHLSYFVFQDAGAGYAIIEQAIVRAYSHGYQTMFVALSEVQLAALGPYIATLSYSVAPATMYATSSVCGQLTINTSEI